MRDLGIANRALMALRPFFFHEPATTEIYTLSLHDALPILFLRGAARGMPAGAAPETNLLGKFGALLGIFGRHHRIVLRQPPFRTIFVRRQAVGRAQMTL